MSTNQDVRVLRPRGWLYVVLSMIAVVTGTLSALARQHAGWSIRSLTLGAFSFIACSALLQLVNRRVILTPQALELRSLWRKKQYPLAELESVTWEAGSGVSVKLVAGGWVRLPELGYDAQGLANTVRAWLKRSKRAAV